MASVASHVRVRLFFVCISTWRFGKFIGGCQTNSSWSGRRDAAKFDVSFCLHNRRRSDNATRPKSAITGHEPDARVISALIAQSLAEAARTYEQASPMSQSGLDTATVTQRRASELARGVFVSPT